MLGSLSSDIICSSKLTIFFHFSLFWTDNVFGQISGHISLQMEAIGYLQVNALSEWIIGIYLHEFTNNERETSIPREVLKISSSLLVNEYR